MADRLNKLHQESVKQKIQVSQLINLLQKHALNDSDLSTTRIDAAKFLLNKRLSNAPTEISADVDSTLNIIMHKPE
jgi:hypothetical protein